MCVYLVRCSETRCCVERNDKVFNSHKSDVRWKMKQLRANFLHLEEEKQCKHSILSWFWLMYWINGCSPSAGRNITSTTLKNNLLFVSWIQMVLSPDSLPVRLIRHLEKGACGLAPCPGSLAPPASVATVSMITTQKQCPTFRYGAQMKAINLASAGYKFKEYLEANSICLLAF